jgi:arabinogalactan endo-1,4-beta-galactosidase
MRRIRAALAAATVAALATAGSDSESTLASWYSTAISDGVSFDIIGLSYYDYWDGRLDVLQADLNGLTAKFGKPALVAETTYPFTLTSNDSSTSLSFSTSSELDPGYPAAIADFAAR